MSYDEIARNSNDEAFADSEEFAIWLENGINRGWVTEPFCYPHDGDVFMTEEEEAAIDNGEDPCTFVLKINGST